jgi:hypothetical protein
MAITVKKITLWRSELNNRPGALAAVLGPLSSAGADLQVVMGYGYPGNSAKAAVELYPVSGKKATAAAQAAGLGAAAIPTLLVTGDNKPGLGSASCRAIADAGINLSFLVAQVVGRKYSAVYGFENDADADRAATLIKKAAAAKKR